MTRNLASSSMTRAAPDDRKDRFATLTFERDVAAPLSVLWQAWTAPAARAVWAAPTPSVTVEFLEADTRVGGREVSLCKVEGQPDIRCEVRLAGIAAGDAQRELRGDLVRGRDAIGSAGDGGFLRHGRAQPAGRDGAAFLAGRGYGGGLPTGLRRGTGQSRGRGRADHGAAAGDTGTASHRLGRVDEPRDAAAMVGTGRVLLSHEEDRPADGRRMGLRHDCAGWHGLPEPPSSMARSGPRKGSAIRCFGARMGRNMPTPGPRSRIRTGQRR